MSVMKRRPDLMRYTISAALLMFAAVAWFAAPADLARANEQSNCDGTQYNPSYSKCCDGTVIAKELSCCAGLGETSGSGFNPETQACCNGSVVGPF